MYLKNERYDVQLMLAGFPSNQVACANRSKVHATCWKVPVSKEFTQSWINLPWRVGDIVHIGTHISPRLVHFRHAWNVIRFAKECVL